MILKDFIQSYNLFELLGIESESAEYKETIQRKVSEEGLARSIEKLINSNTAAQNYFNEKGFEQINQVELLERFPELQTYVVDSIIGLKIEMVKHLVRDCRNKVASNLEMSVEDKNKLVLLLEKVEKALSVDMNNQVEPDLVNDINLFYKKAKELKFIK